jgi:hypothetical protein
MWVLIWSMVYLLNIGHGGVAMATASQEFDSAKACLEAKKVVDAMPSHKVTAVCVRK